MSLDLNKLEKKLDEALNNETTETLTKFFNDKRMTNNKQQKGAFEWIEVKLLQQKNILRNHFEEGKWNDDRCDEIDNCLEFVKQAKEMQKQRMIEFAQSYAVIHCMGDITKNADEYYNETYGGGEQ
jgi:hypothetical protein